MKKLKRLMFEYEDDSLRSVDVADLEPSLLTNLAAAGFCSPADLISDTSHYLILEWNDGWKEVVGVDKNSVNLIRYYVIKRFEDRGRLALDIGETYPQLKIIERQPMGMNRILIVNDQSVKAYELQHVIESYEGIMEDGGKKEYKKFERANPGFKDDLNETDESLAEIKSAIANVVKNKGLPIQGLLQMDQAKRLQEYQEIAKTVGLYGFERQGDVYGLIEMILKKL